MPYTPQTWADLDSTKPVSAARMTVIEKALQAAYAQADTAASAASSAVASATSASTTANSAQSAASSAQTTAGTAQTAANTAQTAANNAQSTANSAQTAAANAQSTANQALTLAQSGGGSGSGVPGAVLLDTFAGSTDDAKLAAAMSAIAAETYPRAIQLSNRQYSFSTGNLAPYDGLKIIGPEGYGNPERSSGAKSPGRVALSMNGPWITCGTGTYYSVSLHGLTFTGGSGATVIGGTSGQFYCLSMRDIFSSGLLSVLGTQANKLLITAASFTGDWEINNCYTGAFHLGGSDNVLWSDGMLLDSGTAFNSAGNSSGQAHLWCDSLDKTYIGPLYITAEGNWRGIRHDGSSNPATAGSTNQGYVAYHGLRLEGRNPSQPCNGSLFTQNGGIAEISSSWIAYGMASPTAGEKGVLQHNGGALDIQGCVYDATNQSMTTNSATAFVYTAGGTGLDCIVQRTKRASRGSVSWGTNRPIVARLTAGAENRICDATVSQVTV